MESPIFREMRRHETQSQEWRNFLRENCRVKAAYQGLVEEAHLSRGLFMESLDDQCGVWDSYNCVPALSQWREFSKPMMSTMDWHISSKVFPSSSTFFKNLRRNFFQLRSHHPWTILWCICRFRMGLERQTPKRIDRSKMERTRSVRRIRRIILHSPIWRLPIIHGTSRQWKRWNLVT